MSEFLKRFLKFIYYLFSPFPSCFYYYGKLPQFYLSFLLLSFKTFCSYIFNFLFLYDPFFNIILFFFIGVIYIFIFQSILIEHLENFLSTQHFLFLYYPSFSGLFVLVFVFHVESFSQMSNVFGCPVLFSSESLKAS